MPERLARLAVRSPPRLRRRLMTVWKTRLDICAEYPLRFIPIEICLKYMTKKYKLYLKTIDCMDGLWDEMNELINLGMLR